MMSNHLHLLVRGPHRPDGFDVPLDVLVAGLERALGETAAGALRKQLEFWRTTKITLAIEEWRQRQLARIFCKLGLAMHLPFAA